MLFWINPGHPYLKYFRAVRRLKRTVKKKAQQRGYLALLAIVFILEFVLIFRPYFIPLGLRKQLLHMVPDIPAEPRLMKMVEEKQ